MSLIKWFHCEAWAGYSRPLSTTVAVGYNSLRATRMEGIGCEPTGSYDSAPVVVLVVLWKRLVQTTAATSERANSKAGPVTTR